jgi:hypothetical protein
MIRIEKSWPEFDENIARWEKGEDKSEISQRHILQFELK